MPDDASPEPVPNVDAVVQRLRSLLGRETISDDYCRLRIDVLQAQGAALAGLGGSSVRPLSADPAREGSPLGPESVPFEAALARRLFGAVAQACRQHGHPGPDLPRLESAVASEPGLLESLVRQAAFGPDEGQLASLGGRLEVSAELLLFVGRLLAAPLVSWAARQLGALPQSGRSCPYCGSAPGLASLRPDDGARLFHCSLCAHRWRFARLACPFCHAGDHGLLVRLTVAGEGARWIEACAHCKHYLKVIDRRQKTHATEPPFFPLVEEVAGLGLDLVAEREGYRRGPPYAALG